MKKPSSKQTRLSHAKMFLRNVVTGQFEKSSARTSQERRSVVYEHRKSTWNSVGQKAIRRGSAEQEEHRQGLNLKIRNRSIHRNTKDRKTEHRQSHVRDVAEDPTLLFFFGRML